MGVDLDRIYGGPYRTRLLVVDDDEDMVLLLKEVLRQAGYDVLSAGSGEEALKKCMEYKPDCVLLDLMMPEMDGWDTFRNIRQITQAPVIMITAVAKKDDVVKGLSLGADDYIVKPFHTPEVIARVQSVLRRAGHQQKIRRLVFPKVDFTLDLNTQEAKIRGISEVLTGREFAIMSLLASHPGDIVRYEVIANQVWGEDKPEVRKRIKYLIYLLRRKIEEVPEEPKIICNAEGVGYKFDGGA